MNQPLIVIIGYQRSGTSFLTRTLNLCGMDLGPFDDLKSTFYTPNSGNLRGDWESKTLTDIFHEVYPEQTPETLRESRELTPLLTDTFRYWLKKLRKRPAIAHGFKIPNIMMYDSLKKLLPENTVYIGIFRNPAKVAASSYGLNNPGNWRDTFPKYEKSWYEHNMKMKSVLKKHNGFLVDFDWDPERLQYEISKICERVGLLKPKYIHNFDKRLVHFADLKERCDPKTEELYNDLKMMSCRNDSLGKKDNFFNYNELIEIMQFQYGEQLKLDKLVNSRILELESTIQKKDKKLYDLGQTTKHPTLHKIINKI